MSKIVIAMCGYAGSGKDTAGAYLVEHFGFQRTAFADPLKEMVKIAFDFTDDQLWGPSSRRNASDERYPFSGVCPSCGRRCNPNPGVRETANDPAWWCQACDRHYPSHVSPRLALQTLGTEWGRRLDVDIWPKAALARIAKSDHDRWVITDLRFPNEAVVMAHMGVGEGAIGMFRVIRLLRGAPLSSHASETSVDAVTAHCLLDNNGPIEDLYSELDRVLAHWGIS